jgi:transcriptional regulator with XRE-family HTH domain
MKKLDNSECLIDFGEFIKTQRERKELTQEDVAQMVGIHRTYYGKIELAKREVDLFTAMKICRVLGIDLSDFIKTQMQ